MVAVTGVTKAGKESRHSLSNTGPRRFLGVECDFSICARDGKTETPLAPLIRTLANQGITVADMCASILMHLAHLGPLTCATYSGGKSYHGSFFVEGETEDKIMRFFRYAVSLGADPLTWTKSQFVRMPDGMRDNGNRQTVYFYSPGLLKSPRE
jgi:hypothetical protein